MNKQRREALAKQIAPLEEVKSQLDDLLSEEQEAFDNMPESIQCSEKGEASSNAIGEIESAISSIEEAISNIENAQGE